MSEVSGQPGFASDPTGINNDELFDDIMGGAEKDAQPENPQEAAKPKEDTEKASEPKPEGSETLPEGAKPAQIDPAAAAAAAMSGKVPEAKQEHVVPLATYLEDRNKLSEENAKLKAQLEAAKKPQQVTEPEVEEIPDAVVDPEGYRRWNEHKVANEVDKATLPMKLELALSRHGEETLGKAAQALIEGRDKGLVDDATFYGIMQSPNRYNATVDWHKRQLQLEQVREIGDPAKYREKLEAELLSSPDFLQKAIAAGKLPANTVVEPPPKNGVLPSASKGGTTTPISQQGGGKLVDLPDDELFEEAYSNRRS